MSLASRVARLVRANLAARFGRVRNAYSPADHDPYREPDRDAYREPDREPHREPYRDPQPAQSSHSDRDPVLAGYYANLELSYGADREAVRGARRRLLARYHPDRFATDPDKARLADGLVKQINHAHDELLKALD